MSTTPPTYRLAREFQFYQRGGPYSGFDKWDLWRWIYNTHISAQSPIINTVNEDKTATLLTERVLRWYRRYKWTTYTNGLYWFKSAGKL